MTNIRNQGSTESLWVKFKNDICVKLRRSSDLKATGIFVILMSQDSCQSDCLVTKFKQPLPKVSFKKETVQKPIVELWTVISNRMIKCQLPDMRFVQISDHKHDIWLYGKLSTKLLAQAANKNPKCMFTTIVRSLFSKVWFQK